MKVLYHKKFDNHFQKLSSRLRDKAIGVVGLFKRNPFDPSLRNHALKGGMSGRRAISVTGDVRIIFEEHGNYVLVIMLDVGSHNQVYS